MLNGYWHFKHLYEKHLKSSMLSPYLMAGIGYAGNNTTNLESRSATQTLAFAGKQKGNFAWQVGVGVLFDINKNIDIDLLYKYADLGKVTSGNLHFDPNDPGAFLGTNAPKDDKLRVHEFLIGCSFKFN